VIADALSRIPGMETIGSILLCSKGFTLGM
jgi:hypothetical protein